MSAKRATEQNVFAAADQLWAAGEEPTYENIIALTGGSTETVGPYLKAWLTKPRPPSVQTPDAIVTQGRVFVASVWANALKSAHSSLDQQRKDATADAVLARAELASAMDQLHDLVSLRDELTRERDQLRVERALAQAEIIQCAELRASLAAAVAERDAVVRDLDRIKGEALANERHIASLMQKFTLTRARKARANAPHGLAVSAPEQPTA